jgi:hypothetical protein
MLRLRRIRVLGLTAILAYWSSIVWLPLEFSRPEGATQRGILARLLEAYYWPPMKALGFLTHLLPYPVFMFYGPFIGVFTAGAISSILWWVGMTLYLRRYSRTLRQPGAGALAH